MCLFEVIGIENVPLEGNVIIAANHKSNLDPIFVASSMTTREVAAVAKKELFDHKILGFILKKLNTIPIDRENTGISTVNVASSMTTREVAAVAKKELFDHKILGFILKKLNTIPIDRENTGISTVKQKLNTIPIDRENTGISTVKQILRAIKDGYVVGLFPEGTRVKGKEFGQAKAGLSLFASKGKANVVPISVISTYKIFSRVKIYIGEPIDMSQYFKAKLTNEDHERISEEVMQVIIKNYCEQARVKGKEFGQAKAGLSLFASKGKANVVPISVISTYKLFSRVKIYIGEPIDMSQYIKAKLTNEDHERISEEVMQVIIKNYCEQADGIVDVEGIEYNA